METYSMLERYERRFKQPKEKKHKLCLRYLTWNTHQISRGNLGRHIPRSEVRDAGLEVRRFNRQNGEALL